MRWFHWTVDQFLEVFNPPNAEVSDCSHAHSGLEVVARSPGLQLFSDADITKWLQQHVCLPAHFLVSRSITVSGGEEIILWTSLLQAYHRRSGSTPVCTPMHSCLSGRVWRDLSGTRPDLRTWVCIPQLASRAGESARRRRGILRTLRMYTSGRRLARRGPAQHPCCCCRAATGAGAGAGGGAGAARRPPLLDPHQGTVPPHGLLAPHAEGLLR